MSNPAGGAERIGWCKPQRSFEHGDPLREFLYGQVDLAPGLQQDQLERTSALILSLDEDSLLRPFRARAGLASPGAELGGWYSSDGFCPGHSFGQWLSALSRCVAIDGNDAARAKVHRLVDGFAATIEPEGKFYKRYPHARGYTYDLLTCGLVDAHRYASHGGALAALAATTRAVIPYLPDKAVPLFGPLVCESDEKCFDHTYVIPENQFIAWQQGGDDLHLRMARRFLCDEVFEPLARGENALPGLHAYTHVNALCSAAKAYLVLGDAKYLAAARQGFAFMEQQSYATGGWGPNEYFIPTPANDDGTIVALDSLHESLEKTRKSFETCCGAYAHLKLTRYLLRITKDSRYGDSMERLIYNTVLGVKPLQPDGLGFYYSSYAPASRKAYLTPNDDVGGTRWPCCSGTLPQVAADYRINAYFADADGVYVNLYMPSTLRWRHRGVNVSLTQEGAYPFGQSVRLRFDCTTPVELTLRVRIPAWAHAPSISVNDKRIATALVPGTFAALRREWRRGDHIELQLPRELALRPVDAQHPDTVALTDGPLVLFAIAEEMPRLTRQQLLSAKRLDTSAHEWTVETSAGRLRLLPWSSLDDASYFTYLRVDR